MTTISSSLFCTCIITRKMININLPIYTCILKYFEKLLTFNNLFTLDLYNKNWLLDVVGGCLLLRRFKALNLEFQVSRSFYFFCRRKAYVYISTYWCCYVLICHSRNTKSNIDDYRKMQKALITTSNGNRLVLQH